MEIGVGISTGDCVVGNMGSDIRFDYSVLGDSVNLASRLEGLTAAYGLRTLCARKRRGYCGDTFAMVEIDSVRVKGKRDVGDESTLSLEARELRRQKPLPCLPRVHSWKCASTTARSDWAAARQALDRSRRNNEIDQFRPGARYLREPPGEAGGDGSEAELGRSLLVDD